MSERIHGDAKVVYDKGTRINSEQGILATTISEPSPDALPAREVTRLKNELMDPLLAAETCVTLAKNLVAEPKDAHAVGLKAVQLHTEIMGALAMSYQGWDPESTPPELFAEALHQVYDLRDPNA